MIEQLVIPCDDGDIVLNVDYDKPGHCADLVKLDADLKLISEGWQGVGESGREAYFTNDTYDYDKHQWETPKGKLIGDLFARVDAGEEF